MSMTKEEAVLWAMGLKFVTDMVMLSTGKTLTVADLEDAITDEEVRSRMLELERRSQ